MNVLSYFTHIDGKYIAWLLWGLYGWTAALLYLKLRRRQFRAYSFYVLIIAPHLTLSLIALAKVLQNRLQDAQPWQVMDIVVANAVGWCILVPALPISTIIFLMAIYEYGKDFPNLQMEMIRRAKIRYVILFVILNLSVAWTQTLSVTPPAS